MMHEALRQRRRKQEARIAVARLYANALRERIGPLSAWVYGSVARGTFKDWSDIDVLVVSPSLPADPVERARVLYENKAPGIEPKGRAAAELAADLQDGDPQVLAMLRERVAIADDLMWEPRLAEAVARHAQKLE